MDDEIELTPSEQAKWQEIANRLKSLDYAMQLLNGDVGWTVEGVLDNANSIYAWIFTPKAESKQ